MLSCVGEGTNEGPFSTDTHRRDVLDGRWENWLERPGERRSIEIPPQGAFPLPLISPSIQPVGTVQGSS